jgi:uncharacterized protein
MKFTREASEGRYTIHAYRHHEALLNALPGDAGQDEEGRLTLRQSFIVMPTRLISPWAVSDITQLGEAELAPLSGQGLEVVLLGTGRALRFPAAEQLAALVGLGIGYEVMDSAAACRTYNILAGEGRQVAAAVIIER